MQQRSMMAVPNAIRSPRSRDGCTEDDRHDETVTLRQPTDVHTVHNRQDVIDISSSGSGLTVH